VPQNTRDAARPDTQGAPAAPATLTWQPPRFEVISLDCEITSYAPDDQPLF
jgi:hypothetical protein